MDYTSNLLCAMTVIMPNSQIVPFINSSQNALEVTSILMSPILQKRKERPVEVDNLAAVALQAGGIAGNRTSCPGSSSYVQSLRCTALKQTLIKAE